MKARVGISKKRLSEEQHSLSCQRLWRVGDSVSSFEAQCWKPELQIIWWITVAMNFCHFSLWIHEIEWTLLSSAFLLMETSCTFSLNRNLFACQCPHPQPFPHCEEPEMPTWATGPDLRLRGLSRVWQGTWGKNRPFERILRTMLC